MFTLFISDGSSAQQTSTGNRKLECAMRVCFHDRRHKITLRFKFNATRELHFCSKKKEKKRIIYAWISCT